LLAWKRVGRGTNAALGPFIAGIGRRSDANDIIIIIASCVNLCSCQNLR
jgi:hypothetical protein